MALFKATSHGSVQMTAQEESEFVAEQASSNSLPNKKLKLREAVNDAKKTRDSKGVVVGGVRYNTDFVSRLQFANAMVYLGRNPSGVATVEDKNGDVVQLDLTAMGAVFDAVNAYVDALSLARKAHFDAIKLLKNDNVDGYDINTLWP